MITIVGAGPAGLRTAELLSKRSEEVTLIEEHQKIGLPIQCTGIVTSSIKDIVPLRNSFIVNKLKKVEIHAPNNSTAEIKLDDIVIDRAKFDQHLAERAEDAGAKILLGARAERIGCIEPKNRSDTKKIDIFDHKTKKHRSIPSDILIGADGPDSTISKHMGNRRPDFWIGVQARAKIHVEKDTYQVYFGKDIPGFFGWMVPENEDTARIGIAATKHADQIFKRFIKRFEKHKIIEMQGGLIPKYSFFKTVEKNSTYLVGDAAGQVKATTGGGLVPGLEAANCLARAITEKISYKRELHKINRELNTSLLIRKMLDRFTDKDYDRLIEMMAGQKMKNIFTETDRDRPTKMLLKAIAVEPKLALFAKVILQRPL